jgi:hypothetical protein
MLNELAKEVIGFDHATINKLVKDGELLIVGGRQ